MSRFLGSFSFVFSVSMVKCQNKNEAAHGKQREKEVEVCGLDLVLIYIMEW